MTVAIVNDYPVVVEGVARILEPDPRVTVVEVDVMGGPHRPVDVALLDTFAASGGGTLPARTRRRPGAEPLPVARHRSSPIRRTTTGRGQVRQ